MTIAPYCTLFEKDIILMGTRIVGGISLTETLAKSLSLSDINPPSFLCSSSAPAVSHKAEGDKPPRYKLHHGNVHGSGKDQFVGWMEYIRTHGLHCTWTS